MPNGNVTIQNLATFELAELPGEAIGLLLAYATSAEKLSRREMESFVIGMTREKAAALGQALLDASIAPPSGRSPPQRN